MLSYPASVRIFICHQAVDLRKSYDGLSGSVQQYLHQDPLSGHLFVFFNNRRTQVKVLQWDRTGYSIYSKRLSQGQFGRTSSEVVTMAELVLLLEGIELAGAHRRKRYNLPLPVRSP